jgi:hypothetical protein
MGSFTVIFHKILEIRKAIFSHLVGLGSYIIVVTSIEFVRSDHCGMEHIINRYRVDFGPDLL